MENKNLKTKSQASLIIVGIIALVVGGAGGFFGGMQYQKSQTSTRLAQFQGAAGTTTRGRFGGANGSATNGMAVRGTVISKDSNSITVKLQDNSTKIIILSSSTTVGKSTTGSIDDVTNGSNVQVFGTTNSDGTVTAQLVQVGGNMFAGPRPSGSPTASPAGQ